MFYIITYLFLLPNCGILSHFFGLAHVFFLFCVCYLSRTVPLFLCNCYTSSLWHSSIFSKLILHFAYTFRVYHDPLPWFCCWDCHTFLTHFLRGTVPFSFVWLSHKFKHTTCIPRWNDVKQSFPRRFNLGYTCCLCMWGICFVSMWILSGTAPMSFVRMSLLSFKTLHLTAFKVIYTIQFCSYIDWTDTYFPLCT